MARSAPEYGGEDVAHAERLQHQHRTATAQPVSGDVDRSPDPRYGAALAVQIGCGEQTRPTAIGRIAGGTDADPAAEPVERIVRRRIGRVSR